MDLTTALNKDREYTFKFKEYKGHDPKGLHVVLKDGEEFKTYLIETKYSLNDVKAYKELLDAVRKEFPCKGSNYDKHFPIYQVIESKDWVGDTIKVGLDGVAKYKLSDGYSVRKLTEADTTRYADWGIEDQLADIADPVVLLKDKKEVTNPNCLPGTLVPNHKSGIVGIYLDTLTVSFKDVLSTKQEEPAVVVTCGDELINKRDPNGVWLIKNDLQTEYFLSIAK